MRAHALILVVLAGCGGPPTEARDAVEDVPTASALVGTWRARPRYPNVFTENVWTLLANGDAVSRSFGSEKASRWSLDGDVLTIGDESGATRTPIVVVGDRIEKAPLVRERDVHEPGVLARWSARIETRYGGDDFVDGERETVTLYDDYRVTTLNERIGSDYQFRIVDEYTCAIESEGEMACRVSPEFLAHLAALWGEESMARERARVERVPFDESTGEPRFAGRFAMTTYWERM